MRRLILFFDGTWNDPMDKTNVYRMAALTKHKADDGIEQHFFYDPGVGSTTGTRILGGAFAYGLTRNLMDGYQWLAKNYRKDDEIWIFGYSRGAYTARSLVGLLNKCGLVKVYTPVLLKEAERLYRNKDIATGDKQSNEFIESYSRRVRIKFLGVWDTVGTLGIPYFWNEYTKFSWHSTSLSPQVDNAFHAMALDEHRALYDVALWTSPTGEPPTAEQTVEQRWFIGAHANVGGGYPEDPLADIPLNWMYYKAKNLGLALKPITEQVLQRQPAAHYFRPALSYDDFLLGIYARYREAFKGDQAKFYRAFDRGWRNQKAINITVDDSVRQRWAISPQQSIPAVDDYYRPKVLVRAGIDLQQSSVTASTESSTPVQQQVVELID